MVDQNQLDTIKQLRATGHSHEEIAKKIGVARSTVAYQLKKLKDNPAPTNKLQVIVAQGFEPNATTVSFDPRIFEQNRKSDTLYATGQDLFEMREGIIHKTTLPAGVKARDYPEIAEIIRNDANWFALPNRDILIRDFKTNLNKAFETKFVSHTDRWTMRNESVGTWNGREQLQLNHKLPFHYRVTLQWIRPYWNKLVESKCNGLLKGMPSANDAPKLLKYIAKLPKSAEQIVEDAYLELLALLEGPRIEEKKSENKQYTLKLIEHPPLIIEYFKKQKIIGKEKISKCITGAVNTPNGLEKFINSGAGSANDFEFLKKIKFPDWPTYLRAKEWAPVLYPLKNQYGGVVGSTLPPPHLNDGEKKRWERAWKTNGAYDVNFRNENHSYIPLKELQKMESYGWNPQNYGEASALGFSSDDFELFSGAEKKLKEVNLRLDKENVAWANKLDWNLEHFIGFPSPKSAVLHDLIQKSPTSYLQLDRLLEQYKRNTNPGPSIGSVDQLHSILSDEPFNKICISNLDGGIVERK